MNEEIKNAIHILKHGGLILFPSDTNWSIGCDASHSDAIQKLLLLKKRPKNKPFTCLVADDRMLKKYVEKIPDAALNIIEITDKPITIIYDDAKNLPESLISNDKTVAIRIPDDEFCFQLCRKISGALVVTSANLDGTSTPKSFKEISSAIFKGVDYVVNLHHEKIISKKTSIIKLSNNGIVKIIKE